MTNSQIERWSFRAALALGFCGTLGLWLYTGYAFTQRIETVRREAEQVAERYTTAQELLSSVRAQVLLSSLRVRDALLDPNATALGEHRRAVEATAQTIDRALREYRPVWRAADETARIETLRQEIHRFHEMSIQVINDAVGRSPSMIREVLNSRVVPRREAALAISEEIVRLNRMAFIEQQTELNTIHRAAELESRQRLGLGLIVGLGTLLLTSAYAWRLEARLRMQMARDARLSGELQQMAAKVLNAQEEERRTIARELHDEVGQVLTAIRVELDVAQRALEGEGGSGAMLSEAQTITDGALQTVRNLSQLLHPSALDDLGLPAVIDASLRGLERRYKIRSEFHQTGLQARLPREVELAAFRIVQEGLTNVAKHAQATECSVRLTRLSDRLLLEIEDNGIGFHDDTERPIVARGLGLVSARERAARLGGTFNILSAPGEGTRLIVTFPEKEQYA
ncbi:MAG TPA: ATP-binding protein [Vicinamibacterales bacterium]|nr:ATP-binding protein [Vicinamibacterales bacterium]